jgi:hypothetical protein
MRKLVLVIIGLFALFTLIRAYTDVKEAPAEAPTVQMSVDM